MPTHKKIQDGVNGCVYFFRIHDTDHVFIGTSTTNNPRMRYGQLSRLIPYKLDLVGWIRTPDFLSLHPKLKLEFATSHILNGWYNLPPVALATTFSRESGADVSEVLDMVLKGTVVALDAVVEIPVSEEMGAIEKFMNEMAWEAKEVSFAGALRSFRVLVNTNMSIGDFRKEICSLGYKMTYDNKGFFTKRS